MNINDIEDFRLGDAIKFHPTLNKRIFTDERLQEDVRDQLMLIAADFVDFMGIDTLKVTDVRLYGSNAAYTYTKHSDIDLHVLVDMSEINDDRVYRELFNSKKNLYNDSLDITVRGMPVELYMQSSTDVVKSLGDYSVMNDHWVKFPTKSKASLEEHSAKEKFKRLVVTAELALRSRDIDRVNDLIDTLKRYRSAGLERGGEFSPENLAAKALRSRGITDKLYQHRDRLHSDELSIDEDYDAANPPGPEFPPTMPAGTVKVDVSDTYDWYKLGQHISNLDGLGKHDFGQGPPSMIMSFGSEEAEHRYIDALKKTGLTTTDIDPIDPRQPRGMPRQKVDRTYNVDESVESRLRAELKQFMEGSGYVPSNAERNDSRFKTALSVDVDPNIMPRQAKVMGLGKIARDGRPQRLSSSGKYTR
jgi:predicted nucleotidyltransferase